MGDIICCLDESGSTEGEAAAWGKAVAMTLLEIAAESHRSFALIHFAGGSSCQVDIFRPGEYTLEDKLSAAETFFGGGTNFERPIREVIQLMDTEGFEKAMWFSSRMANVSCPMPASRNCRRHRPRIISR